LQILGLQRDSANQQSNRKSKAIHQRGKEEITAKREQDLSQGLPPNGPSSLNVGRQIWGTGWTSWDGTGRNRKRLGAHGQKRIQSKGRAGAGSQGRALRQEDEFSLKLSHRWGAATQHGRRACRSFEDLWGQDIKPRGVSDMLEKLEQPILRVPEKKKPGLRQPAGGGA